MAGAGRPGRQFLAIPPLRARCSDRARSAAARILAATGARGADRRFPIALAEIQTTIGRLAAIQVSGHLLQVLDPAEADLPYSRRIRFRGLEREADTLIPRVEGVRGEYARRLKAQQEGLAAICAAADFGFAIHRTDHPPEAALLGLYLALTAR
jgi:uncharacterized protein (DUF58 family)